LGVEHPGLTRPLLGVCEVVVDIRMWCYTFTLHRDTPLYSPGFFLNADVRLATQAHSLVWRREASHTHSHRQHAGVRAHGGAAVVAGGGFSDAARGSTTGVEDLQENSRQSRFFTTPSQTHGAGACCVRVLRVTGPALL
jgi:hypothetical protein